MPSVPTLPPGPLSNRQRNPSRSPNRLVLLRPQMIRKRPDQPASLRRHLQPKVLHNQPMPATHRNALTVHSITHPVLQV